MVAPVGKRFLKMMDTNRGLCFTNCQWRNKYE
jgi:hypothetical protein